MKLPPRVSLGSFPTPLDSLPRLSAELGVEVVAKRDDLTGLALGGNKIRKLEMLLAEALAQGADAVVTCGAVQSNHCRCTAAAAAKLGLGCGLVLFEGRHNENGNLLLDQLFGAVVERHPSSERDGAEELMTRLGARYRRPYLIPFGGSNALGAAAYAWCYQELVEQLGGRRGTLFCFTSSGATHAGLALGAAMLGGGPAVVGISVGDPAAACEARLVPLLAGAAGLLGFEGEVHAAVLDAYRGEGYGIPSPAGNDAIRRLARTEGILLDPVYTGKAMAGLLAESARYEPPLVFLHSGGVPALFAYADELTPA
jgi:D-cysteine desulfhydrase family pyridoxal phosphate-dependent enzyme